MGMYIYVCNLIKKKLNVHIHLYDCPNSKEMVYQRAIYAYHHFGLTPIKKTMPLYHHAGLKSDFPVSADYLMSISTKIAYHIGQILVKHPTHGKRLSTDVCVSGLFGEFYDDPYL